MNKMYSDIRIYKIMFVNQFWLLTFMVCFSVGMTSQTYTDYIGAGHNNGVKVRTSSNNGLSIGDNTINGSGLDAKKIDASRFLFQASFGASMEEIEALATTQDYNGWIETHFNQPMTLMLPKLWEVNERSMQLFEAEKENPDDEYFGPWAVHFNYAWWDNNYKAPDQLRQRVAYALSQILVISINSELANHGDGLSSYYDILVRNAFGNYEDILQEVTLDPNMAFYLSHLNNPKTNEELGTRPDENYAREIMQLFSIGLYELNNDGSRKTDASGEWIPTYDNSDIQGLAKVFTGLKGAEWSRQAIMYGINPNIPVEFGTDINGVTREMPLQMDEFFHEPGPKTIIGGHTIPEGQTGLEDIRQAVHHIFMHPNVGPFIARRLIQQLVKSNPSPAYINRVASAFNDNGQGSRGDLKSVVKSILLDQEARECSYMSEPSSGKLKEPMLRYTQLMHAIPTDSPEGYYWNNGFDFLESTKQQVMAAPSVFNFYTPDFQPTGDFTDQDLNAPEFKIHDSQTAIGYMNQAHKWTDWNVLFWDWHDSAPDVLMDYGQLFLLARDAETLINHLDVLLTHGRLSDETRATIKQAIQSIPLNWDDTELWRTRIAVYLFMISPDYVVLK